MNNQQQIDPRACPRCMEYPCKCVGGGGSDEEELELDDELSSEDELEKVMAQRTDPGLNLYYQSMPVDYLINQENAHFALEGQRGGGISYSAFITLYSGMWENPQSEAIDANDGLEQGQEQKDDDVSSFTP